MHPTLTRYLNPAAAFETLARQQRGELLSDEERAYVAAARAHPEETAALTARNKTPPAPEAQKAVLWLAAYAAVESLRDDGTMGPLAEAARQALTAEGATPAEADNMLASLILEEGFTGDDDVDVFDRAFVEESLKEMPALARLTAEQVDALRESFVKGAAADWKRAHQLAMDALLESAWGEGPLPINSEHMAEAVDAVQARLGEAQAPKGLEALRRAVQHLAQAGLIGPRRQARLVDVVELAEQEAGGGPAH